MNESYYDKKYFKVNELNADTVLLSTNLTFIKESNLSFLLDALILISTKANKKLVVDISKTDYIDSNCGSMLAETILDLNSHGKSIKLVVSEKKPIIPYSIGHPVAKLDVYLTQKSALHEILN